MSDATYEAAASRLARNERPDGVDDGDEGCVVSDPWVDAHVVVVGSSKDGYVRVGAVTRHDDVVTVSLVPGDEAPGDAWVYLRDVREVERLITALEDCSYRTFQREVPTPGELVGRAVDVLERLRDVVAVTRETLTGRSSVSRDRDESDGEVLARLGTDAREWAAEFTCTFAGETVGTGRVDEGTLTGWFANALEAGRTAGEHDAVTRETG